MSKTLIQRLSAFGDLMPAECWGWIRRAALKRGLPADQVDPVIVAARGSVGRP